jgi:hypothetical protein
VRRWDGGEKDGDGEEKEWEDGRVSEWGIEERSKV